MNPLEAIKNFIKIGNPKDALMKMMSENSNPIMNNLIEMAEKGDTKGVENFARNICKEKGINFDKEFSNFMNNFKK